MRRVRTAHMQRLEPRSWTLILLLTFNRLQAKNKNKPYTEHLIHTVGPGKIRQGNKVALFKKKSLQRHFTSPGGFFCLHCMDQMLSFWLCFSFSSGVYKLTKSGLKICRAAL